MRRKRVFIDTARFVLYVGGNHLAFARDEAIDRTAPQQRVETSANDFTPGSNDLNGLHFLIGADDRFDVISTCLVRALNGFSAHFQAAVFYIKQFGSAAFKQNLAASAVLHLGGIDRLLPLRDVYLGGAVHLNGHHAELKIVKLKSSILATEDEICHCRLFGSQIRKGISASSALDHHVTLWIGNDRRNICALPRNRYVQLLVQMLCIRESLGGCTNLYHVVLRGHFDQIIPAAECNIDPACTHLTAPIASVALVHKLHIKIENIGFGRVVSPDSINLLPIELYAAVFLDQQRAVVKRGLLGIGPANILKSPNPRRSHDIGFLFKIEGLRIRFFPIAEGYVIDLHLAVLATPNQKAGAWIDRAVNGVTAGSLCDHVSVRRNGGDNNFFRRSPFKRTVIGLIQHVGGFVVRPSALGKRIGLVTGTDADLARIVAASEFDLVVISRNRKIKLSVPGSRSPQRSIVAEIGNLYVKGYLVRF